MAKGILRILYCSFHEMNIQHHHYMASLIFNKLKPNYSFRNNIPPEGYVAYEQGFYKSCYKMNIITSSIWLSIYIFNKSESKGLVPKNIQMDSIGFVVIEQGFCGSYPVPLIKWVRLHAVCAFKPSYTVI